jgi:hypothetical protein
MVAVQCFGWGVLSAQRHNKSAGWLMCGGAANVHCLLAWQQTAQPLQQQQCSVVVLEAPDCRQPMVAVHMGGLKLQDVMWFWSCICMLRR